MTKEEFQNLGEPYRQALGIDGTAGDAQDIPHPYTPHAHSDGCCIVCGMAAVWRKHTGHAAPPEVEREETP